MTKPSAHPIRRAALLAAGLGPALAWAEAEREVPLFVGEHSTHRIWRRLFALLGRSAGLRWQIRTAPWPRAQMLAERGEGLMFGLRRTARRDVRFYFSRPVLTLSSWVVVRSGGSWAPNQPADLNGRRICVGRGSSYDEALREQGVDQVIWLESDQGDPGALRMLRAGRCEAALLTGPGGSAPAAATLLRESGLDLDGLELLPRAVLSTELHFVCGPRGNWRWALTRLDEAIVTERAAIDALMRQDA